MPRESTQAMTFGSPAPAFSLLEPISGRRVSSADYEGKRLLVTFITHDCVTVNLIRAELIRFAREYQQMGLEIVAVNPNKGGLGKEMRQDVKRFGYPFPYLLDETQETTRRYGVVCTPEFFLFDQMHELFYLGQFDDSRPGNGKYPNGADVRAAADALLNGKPAPVIQKASFGCSVVWEASEMAAVS